MLSTNPTPSRPPPPEFRARFGVLLLGGRLHRHEPRPWHYISRVLVVAALTYLLLFFIPFHGSARYSLTLQSFAQDNPEIAHRLIPLCVAFCLALAFLAARVAYRNDLSVWWRAHGRCAGCGYDLTATPEKCPECGRWVMKHF